MSIKSASDLREKFGGVALGFKWLGIEKKAEFQEVSEVASLLNATTNAVKVQKVLIDTKDPSYKKLTSLKNKLRSLWIDNTLPWIEPGVRLMHKGLIEGFQKEQFEPLKLAMGAAVEQLAARWDEVLAEAPGRLGKLFNPDDYPKSPLGLFDCFLSFPNLEPPGYLPPEVFEQQSKAVQKQFEEALKIGEAMLADELQKLVTNLADRLSPDVDGKPKVFKEASVQGVYDFFEKIAKLGMGSSAELENAISQVKDVLGGCTAKDLKGLSVDTKTTLSEQLKKVGESLESSVQVLPRRKLNIAKKNKTPQEGVGV